MRALVFITAVALSGCASVPSDPPTTYVSRCPPLKQYTRTQQTQLADELQKLPAGSVVGAVVGDFYQMRKACRAIDAVAR